MSRELEKRVKSSAVEGPGGTVSWRPGVVFNGNIQIMGVSIDNNTQLPVPNNFVKTNIVVWVDFLFEDCNLPVLGFIELSLKNVEKIFAGLKRL